MRTHSAVSSDISYFKCISDIKKYLAPPTSLNMSHFALFFGDMFSGQISRFFLQSGVVTKINTRSILSFILPYSIRVDPIGMFLG